MRQTQIRKSLIVRLPIERFVPRFEFTHKPHFISNIKIYQMHFSNYTAVSKHFPQTKYKIYISPQMYYIISDMKCTNRCWSFLLFSLFFNRIWNKREIKNISIYCSSKVTWIMFTTGVSQMTSNSHVLQLSVLMYCRQLLHLKIEHADKLNIYEVC